MFKWVGRLAPPGFCLGHMRPVVTIGYVGLGNRPGHSGLFQEAAKEESAATGIASVEPKGELLQVRL